MSLLREAPKQNTGWTFSVRPQVLLLCREQAPWTTSALFSGTTSLLAKDPASGPTAHLQQSPQKGVSWCQSAWPLPLLPGGCCPVLLVLSPPPAAIITTGSPAASPQSQGITCSVPCPIYTAAPARPPPAHAPAHRAPTAEIFLPTRARGSPTSTAPRVLSWQH